MIPIPHPLLPVYGGKWLKRRKASWKSMGGYPRLLSIFNDYEYFPPSPSATLRVLPPASGEKEPHL